MKRIFVVSAFLSVLLAPAIAHPVQASSCMDSVSFVVLPSGRCVNLSTSMQLSRKASNSPLEVSGLKLKQGSTKDDMLVVGSLTNTSNTVYRDPLVTVQIGENRLEEVTVPGLIGPGQTRNFELGVQRDKYSLKAPVSVESVEASDR